MFVPARASEINRVTIEPNGFKVAFTKPVDAATGGDPKAYKLGTFTHPYHGGYGGPEIEKTTPDKSIRGHVYEFDLGAPRSRDRDEL